MNFYLLYGTDASIIGREIDIIKEKLSISDNDVIYYNIEDIQSVVDEALTISIFSANKLIIIDSTIYLSQKKDIENINLLENYFNNYNSNSYLVFVSNSDNIDSRKKLVKLINNNGTTKKVEANSEYLSDYVNDYLKKKNYKMSSMDINIFINRVGNNIDNIKNELDKLMLYKIDDKVINNSDIKNKSEIITSFWNLFVADALIGNPDRHLDNVDLLYNKVTDSYSFSPIYDCGSSLHALLSYEKKEELLKNDTEFKNACYNVFSVYKLNGKKVFYNEIFKNPPEDLKQAILRIIHRINIEKINNIIDDTEGLLPLEKEFIKKSIKVRKEEILDKAYQKISKTI